MGVIDHAIAVLESVATSAEIMLEYNPNHDGKGRFASKSGGGAGMTSGGNDDPVTGAAAAFESLKGRWDGKDSSITTIDSLEEIQGLAIGAEANGEQLFVRYSKGPATDAKGGWNSRDHAAGTTHNGVSAENITSIDGPFATGGKYYTSQGIASYAYLEVQGGGRAYLLTGRVTGRDSDNAYLIKDVKPLAFVGPKAVADARANARELDDIATEYRQSKRLGVSAERRAAASKAYFEIGLETSISDAERSRLAKKAADARWAQHPEDRA